MQRRVRGAVLLGIAGLAIAALAGCQYPSRQEVARLNAAIGKNETALVQQFGVPTRTYDTPGHKFVAYQHSRIESLPGDPDPLFLGYGGFGYGGFGYGGFGYPLGFYPGYPPTIVQRDCDTTFDLVNGVVQSWKLRGNDCG